MCGLAGFVGKVDEGAAQTVLDAMARGLVHRGPDHQGTHLQKLDGELRLGFSQTLLAIIGKTGEGVQPFKVPGGVLVFNGAIYNFKELRPSLETKGRVFRTQCDTEVLAHGLAEEGLAFLERTRGMFAFAFWNEREKKLWLGRDPFGVKPLYYALTATGIVFASEYKVILPHLRDAEIDDKAVFDYLRLRYVPEEATFIRAIRKVAPGTVLELAPPATAPRMIRYFTSRADGAVPTPDALFAKIETAISRRAVADVEVASLLSGGIDSSLVSDVLEHSVKEIHTYTLGFQGMKIDESDAAREISRRIGARNTTLAGEPPTIETLGKLTYHLDDPYGDPIILALDSIFSSIKGKQRVLVTGEGSDEIFSGYVHHRVMGMAEKIPAPMLRLAASVGDATPFPLLNRLFPYAGKMTTRDFDAARTRFRHFAAERSLYAFQSIFFLFDDGDFTRSGETHLRSGDSAPTLRDLRAWDLANWLPHSQLFKLDKISMASSIEAREPFVDQDLIATVSAISPQRHISSKTDKPMLRQAVTGHTRIPESVVIGRKSSFFQPFTGPKNSRLRDDIRETARGSREFIGRYLNDAVLESALGDEREGLLSQKRLFALGALALWRDRIYRLAGTGVSLDGK